MTNMTTAPDKAFETPRDLRSKLSMWFDTEHVCVLTIGKTASSALIGGLIDGGVPAYQAHTLHRAPQDYLFVDGLPARPLQNAAFQAKTAAWLRLTRNRTKRFITTFRDPFARNVSAFFEQSWKLGVQVEDMSTQELVELYDRHGPHDATRNWVAQNLTYPLGLKVGDIDLISSPTQEISLGKRQFLLMKYEDQNVWEEALGRFVGAPVTLPRRNDSMRKSYSDAISRLNAAWRPSPEIVARSLDQGLWDAIYSEAEKDRIRSRWDIPRNLAP